MYEDTDLSSSLDRCLPFRQKTLYIKRPQPRHLSKPSHIHSRLWLKQTGLDQVTSLLANSQSR